MITFMYLPSDTPARWLPKSVVRHASDKYGKNAGACAASYAAYEALARLYAMRVFPQLYSTGYADTPNLIPCAVSDGGCRYVARTSCAFDSNGVARLPDIGYTAEGRPYFLHEQEMHLSFSLSHTDGMSIAALSDQGAIGIDIERVTVERYSLHRKLAKSRFFAGERMDLSRHAEDEHAQTRDILRLWTRKEAISKALGVPLASVCTARLSDRLCIQSCTVREHYLVTLAFSVGSTVKNI